MWAWSRHADVEKALVNWQTFSGARGDILFEDPPHTLHRALMSRVFTPKRMAALESPVREFCANVV